MGKLHAGANVGQSSTSVICAGENLVALADFSAVKFSLLKFRLAPSQWQPTLETSQELATTKLGLFKLPS
jgi:hypothetical protein